MFCAISGEIPQEPVVSVKTGHLYEKRIIDKHLKAVPKCPVTGVEMTEDDLMSVHINKALRPRSLVATSIPGLLSNLQNEWDELMLETFALKSQLDSTRQELAQALYQHDASCRVIARLMRERDEARSMLAAAASSSQISAAKTSSASSAAGGQRPMDVSSTTGPDQADAAAAVTPSTGSFSTVVVDALNKKCGELSGARKGRAKALEAAGLVLSKDTLASWSMQKTFTPHKSDKGAIHCCATYSTSSSSSSNSQSDILVTGGADNCVFLTDAVSGAVMSKLAGHSKKVTSVALRQLHQGVSRDDETTGIVVFTASADKTVKMWAQSSSEDGSGSATKGRKGAKSKAATAAASPPELRMNESASYGFHTGEVTALSLHPTGDYLLTTSLDGSWGFVDISTSACLGQVVLGSTAADQLLCGQLHPDGLLFGTGTAGGALKVWDIREQKSVLEFSSPCPSGAKSVRCLSFSENGYLLAAGGDDGGANIWDLRKLKTIKTVDSANSTVSAVAFDYSGTYLALGTGDGTVRVAVVKDWAEPLVLGGLHTKAVSALRWGGQAAVGAVGKQSYLVSCSLDRTCKVVGDMA